MTDINIDSPTNSCASQSDEKTELPSSVVSFVYLKTGFLRTRWHAETPNLVNLICKHILWCLEKRKWYQTGSLSIDLLHRIIGPVLSTDIPSPMHPSDDCNELKQWAEANQLYNYILIPSIMHCIQCQSKLSIQHDSTCYVYDDQHPRELGARSTAFKKVCCNEHCKWNAKYYIGCCEYTDPKTQATYFLRFRNADSHRFWFCTPETYITTQSLSRALHEQYHGHSGVSTIADLWNNFHNNQVKPKRGWIIDVFS